MWRSFDGTAMIETGRDDASLFPATRYVVNADRRMLDETVALGGRLQLSTFNKDTGYHGEIKWPDGSRFWAQGSRAEKDEVIALLQKEIDRVRSRPTS
jgi:hypothetical protein